MVVAVFVSLKIIRYNLAHMQATHAVFFDFQVFIRGASSGDLFLRFTASFAKVFVSDLRR